MDYTRLHYPTLHWAAMGYTGIHYGTQHYTAQHYTTRHYTTPYYATIRYTKLHYEGASFLTTSGSVPDFEQNANAVGQFRNQSGVQLEISPNFIPGVPRRHTRL